MLIYNIGETGGGKMFKNKELFRVVMIFVIGIILILMTPVLFKVVMELFSK